MSTPGWGDTALRSVLWLALGGWIGAWFLFAFGVSITAFRALPNAELAGRVRGAHTTQHVLQVAQPVGEPVAVAQRDHDREGRTQHGRSHERPHSEIDDGEHFLTVPSHTRGVATLPVSGFPASRLSAWR